MSWFSVGSENKKRFHWLIRGKQEKYGGGGGWKSKEMWWRWWREIKRNVAVRGRGIEM